MCSVLINATMNEQMAFLGSADTSLIERRLFQFASEANPNQSGGLDNPAWIWKRRPQELKDASARKIRIGRHRVYYVGSHKQCSYRAFYVKPFKKSGVDDEDDPKHQKKLIRAVAEPSKREIRNPDSDDDESNDS